MSQPDMSQMTANLSDDVSAGLKRQTRGTTDMSQPDMSQMTGDPADSIQPSRPSSKGNPIPAAVPSQRPRIQFVRAPSAQKCKGSNSSRHKSCEHKARRTQCAQCSGGSVCNHGRQKHLCKECKGTSLCEHMRQRSKCKECVE
jgi:hypothetical protein